MKTYYISGVDCAHCAMKIEEKLASLPEVASASLSFATGELNIASVGDTDIFPLICSVVKRLEPEATVSQEKSIHTEAVACSCESCGHDHNHSHRHKEAPSTQSSRLKNVLPLLPIAVAILLLIPALLLGEGIASLVLFLASGLLAGWKVFLKGLKKLFHFSFDENILLLIAFVAAFCIGEYLEACMVVILFSFGEYLEDLAVSRSKRSIEALTKILPENASVLENGTPVIKACKEVMIGDTILIKPGERVPLDCIILTGETQIDNAAITGESLPVSAGVGESLLSGSINLTTAVTAKVTYRFVDSTASRIIDMVKNSAAQKGAAENFISRFAKIYTPIVILAAILIAVFPPLLGLGSFSRWIYTALILLVAACPCAMVISVPLGFFSCIGAESKIGVLIKGGRYVEALSKLEAIAFDKTGTLTTGSLSVEKAESYLPELSDDRLLALTAACEQYSTHPIAVSIAKSAPPAEVTVNEFQELRGMGVSAAIDGRTYLCGGKRMLEHYGIPTETLPFANVYLAERESGKVLGGITVRDTVRPESRQIIQDLRTVGLQEIRILSGDTETAVAQCAKELQIDYRASLMPQDKVMQIQQLKQHGKAAFVGDGINDAPVLAAADVGIAMGLGSDSAIEAADAVLVSGNLFSLADGIRLAKKCMRIIHFNVSLALTAKLIVFLLALFGAGQMWMAVVADVGVSILSVLNAARLLGRPESNP